jgi:class 3 adenylate cyclase
VLVLDGVSNLLARVIRLGRDPAMLPSEARYVVLTNIVALLGALFSLGFAPVLLLTGTWLYPTMQVGYALAYLPTLLLNHRGRHVLATLWLVLGAHLLVMSQVFVEGMAFDVHLFFMLHAVLPFLLFPPGHDKATFAMSALAGLDMVLAITFGERLGHVGPAIEPHALLVIRPVLMGGLFATLAACGYYARRATLLAEAALDRAHQRSEHLLLNVLPASIASRLKAHDGTIADRFGDVTVLFADIVGFTTLSARLTPDRVVELLNELFCRYDDLAGELGLEKIKTIGDCYMVAGGLPVPRVDHAEAVAEMALAMQRVTREFRETSGEAIQVRVGLHSGPVVAGVIGKRKFIYDLWGDTVNMASRMESHGVPDAVHLTEASYDLLAGKYRMTSRGTVEIKGKGPMQTWILDGPKVATATEQWSLPGATGRCGGEP